MFIIGVKMFNKLPYKYNVSIIMFLDGRYMIGLLLILFKARSSLLRVNLGVQFRINDIIKIMCYLMCTLYVFTQRYVYMGKLRL